MNGGTGTDMTDAGTDMTENETDMTGAMDATGTGMRHATGTDIRGATDATGPDTSGPATDESVATARNVSALLLALRAQRRSATVRVSGTPGGTIHLRDGLVVAVETPGAPTVEAVLLRSGRIGDADWARVCAADPSGERRAAELHHRALVGAVELQVICTATAFDGAFAMSLSAPAGWDVTDRVPTLGVEPGIEPGRLTQETSRRLASLSRLIGAPADAARSPVRVADGPVVGYAGSPASPEGRPGVLSSQVMSSSPAVHCARHAEILACVNGRRTPRDIAFALGRGLYPVLLDLVRMEGLGLVRRESRTTHSGRPSTAPRSAAPAGQPSFEPPERGPLPRRSPGGHGPKSSSSPGETNSA